MRSVEALLFRHEFCLNLFRMFGLFLLIWSVSHIFALRLNSFFEHFSKYRLGVENVKFAGVPREEFNQGAVFYRALIIF